MQQINILINMKKQPLFSVSGVSGFETHFLSQDFQILRRSLITFGIDYLEEMPSCSWTKV